MPVATSLAITSATTSFYIGATKPTTYDGAGFAAVTWTKVGEISNFGTLGGQTNIVTHIPVDTSAVVKRTGSVDYGTMDLQGARTTDAGLTALRSFFTSRASTAFKVVYPTALGQVDYFTGVVASNQTNVANADSILGFSVQVAIDNEILSV
jgi:hypothetical protein